MKIRYKNHLYIVISSFVLCFTGYFRGLNRWDPLTHTIFSRQFTNQFLQGDFMPRWLVNENAGFGAPSLLYYPSLQYYLNLLLTPLRLLDQEFSLENGFLAIMTTGVICMTLSGLAMYKYAQLHTDETRAFLVSIFYVTVPYHFTIEYYLHFALPELCSLIFMPLCLYYAEKGKIIKLSFSYAAMVLLHLLTAGIFTIPFTIYLFIKKYYDRLWAIGLGICISAYYILPALSNHDLINLSLIDPLRPYYAFFLDNKSSPDGVVDYYRFGALIMLLTATIGFFKAEKKQYFWFLCLFGSLFMTISPSALIWENLSFLANLTFPWRFLTVTSFFAALLLLSQIDKTYLIGFIIINIAFSYQGVMAVTYRVYSTQEQHDMVFIDDYRTKWTDKEILSTETYKRDPVFLLNSKFPDIQIKREARKLIISSTKPGWVTIPHFYFPNWQGEYEIRPEAHTGFIEINFLNPGTTTLYFTRNLQEKVGLVITGVTILGIFLARFRKAK